MPRRLLIPNVVVLLAALLAALAVWFPVLHVPFWGDDYGFLFHAWERAEEGQSPWLAMLVPQGSLLWRPLSTTLPWGFVQALGLSATFCHAMNLALLAGIVAGSWCLVRRFAGVALGRTLPAATAFHLALIVALHPALFLPMAWACGLQELLALFFSLLALRAWVGLIAAHRAAADLVWIPLTPVFLLAALLSKEGTVVLPALMACVWALAYGVGPRRVCSARHAAPWLGIAFGLTIGWYVVRSGMVEAAPPESPYALALGAHNARNAGLLAAYAGGVPREALRLLREGSPALGTLWAVASFVLVTGGLLLATGPALRRQPRALLRRVLPAVLFFVFAATPYLFPRQVAYGYYVLLGLLAVPLGLVLVPSVWRRLGWLTVGLALSSSLTIAAEFRAPYPGTLSRAGWAGEAIVQALVILGRNPGEEQTIALLEDDVNRYAALAGHRVFCWRLGLPESQVFRAEDAASARAAGAEIVLQLTPEGFRRVP